MKAADERLGCDKAPLEKDGWYEVNQVCTHKQFKHPTKKGCATHPKRDMPIGTLKSIEKQAGIKL